MPCMCGSSECTCGGNCICTSQVCRCERCSRVPFRKRFIASLTEMNDPNKPPEVKEVRQEIEHRENTQPGKISESGQAICQSTQIALKESLSTVLREPSEKAFRTETVIKYVGSEVSPQKRKLSSPKSSPPANTETFSSPGKKGKSSSIDLNTNKSNVPKIIDNLGSSPQIPRAQTDQQNADIEQLRMKCGMRKLISVNFRCGINVVHNCRTGCVLNLPTAASSRLAEWHPILVSLLQAPPLNASPSQAACTTRILSQTRQPCINLQTISMDCCNYIPKLIELHFACGDREVHNCRLSPTECLSTDNSPQINAVPRLHCSPFDERKSQAESMDGSGPSNPEEGSLPGQLEREEKRHGSDNPESSD